MRRLLRIWEPEVPRPRRQGLFFLLSLAELLPRDVEKRRKARERPRKGRRQPESARETGRPTALPEVPRPRRQGLFFLLSLAELLPRDVEKRRKARERPRKGRRQPESARETGR
ncbi:hypothetical protein NDU88_004064 [Pleurodeles waltl]|uniref:Uncharacterized protein n=1 Tax=Pleurodeles waltl TaxID=8319 RepID=A0AAV7REP7_PLEWA|nr:hypothetical protein NDU88_004064 [Pleurodeles waltl]